MLFITQLLFSNCISFLPHSLQLGKEKYYKLTDFPGLFCCRLWVDCHIKLCTNEFSLQHRLLRLRSPVMLLLAPLLSWASPQLSLESWLPLQVCYNTHVLLN